MVSRLLPAPECSLDYSGVVLLYTCLCITVVLTWSSNCNLSLCLSVCSKFFLSIILLIWRWGWLWSTHIVCLVFPVRPRQLKHSGCLQWLVIVFPINQTNYTDFHLLSSIPMNEHNKCDFPTCGIPRWKVNSHVILVLHQLKWQITNYLVPIKHRAIQSQKTSFPKFSSDLSVTRDVELLIQAMFFTMG